MNAWKALAAAVAATLSIAAHAVGHRADVTVIDRSTGRTLPVFWHEGRAYVAGNPGNEYQVTVRNRQGEDVLAVVSVDGLNVVNGRTADTAQSGYVLGPWGGLDIRGWRKSMDETAAFYFTSLGDSYAGRTGRPDNVGVIGVALFERARPRYEPPVAEVAPAEPRRERNSADAAGASSEAKRAMPAPSSSITAPAAAASPLATGHGRREDSRATYTSFERSTRHPIEVVEIRYDSYRNLVAQGVIPTYGQRREPRAFPGSFTPDP